MTTLMRRQTTIAYEKAAYKPQITPVVGFLITPSVTVFFAPAGAGLPKAGQNTKLKRTPPRPN